MATIPINLGPGITGGFSGNPLDLGSIDLENSAGIPTPLAASTPNAPLGSGGLLGGLPALPTLPSLPNPFSGLLGATNPAGSSRGLGDYVAIIAGLVFIAGGILMFKQTQTIISTAGEHGRRAAELVGAVAA